MLACRCCLRAFARLSLSLASLLLAKVSACMGRVCRLYRYFQEYVFTLKCIGRIVQIRSAFSFQQMNPLYTSTSLAIRVQRDWNTVTCRYSEAGLYKNILQIRSLQKNDQTHENQNISDAADAANRFQRFWATEPLKWFIHTMWNYQTIPDTHPAASCLVQGFFILIQQVESWRSSGKDCTSSYQHKRHQYIATTLRLIATNFLHPDL